MHNFRTTLRRCGGTTFAFLVACGTANAAAPVGSETPLSEPTSLPVSEPAAPAETVAQTSEFDVQPWGQLLAEYTTTDGGFRYEALMANAESMAALDAVVASIASADVTGWSREATLAFYINAYNANVVRQVISLWPLDGVLTVEGFFDAKTITVAGATLTLNDLENVKIREAFKEPRIHFLVNCASVGCPWLIAEPITAANLEEKLAAQARAFVDRTSIIDEGGHKFQVSQLFTWFAADFEGVGGVRAFLAAHSTSHSDFFANESNSMEYFEYDWALNRR